MNWSGARNARGNSTLSLAVVGDRIYVDMEGRINSTWGGVSYEMTGQYLSSHQVGVILMVGVNVPLTRS